jgi:hypothetical protein
MAVYDLKQSVRLTAEFKDATGALVNPTTITFKALKPVSKTVLSYATPATQIVEDSTGEYHVDVVADEPGAWVYRFEATGNVVCAKETSFQVASSSF